MVVSNKVLSKTGSNDVPPRTPPKKIISKTKNTSYNNGASFSFMVSQGKYDSTLSELQKNGLLKTSFAQFYAYRKVANIAEFPYTVQPWFP